MFYKTTIHLEGQLITCEYRLNKVDSVQAALANVSVDIDVHSCVITTVLSLVDAPDPVVNRNLLR